MLKAQERVGIKMVKPQKIFKSSPPRMLEKSKKMSA